MLRGVLVKGIAGPSYNLSGDLNLTLTWCVVKKRAQSHHIANAEEASISTAVESSAS